jgi:hypothetical protein
MKKVFLSFIFLTCCCPFSNSQIDKNVQTSEFESITTTLSSSCEKYGSKEGTYFDYIVKCKGVGDYHLIYSNGFMSDELSLLTPTGDKIRLDLWAKIKNPSHSVVNQTVEWRIIREKEKIKPIALIVGAGASSPRTHDGKGGSYLVVIKLTNSANCITDFVDRTSKDAETIARKLADDSTNRLCLFPKTEKKD